MHTDFVALIRAHAVALVRMARVQTDLEHALALEAVALDLLRATQEFELKIKRG